MSLVAVLLQPTTSLAAESSIVKDENELHLKDVVLQLPTSFKRTFTEAFTRDKLWPWAFVIGSTWITYKYDEEFIAESQRLGRRWGLGNEDHTKTVLEVGPYPILRLPSDAGSTLYFLGDGWMHMGIAAGFLARGQWGASTRAFNTGVEMVHGMVLSTVFNQALKRSTGREAPNRSTEPRGKWRPFPSVKAYNENTAMYDAMPSGHIMTASLVMTVALGNYPEYKYWIWPVGLTWLTALGYQMMNNGVHWASDYPLGIAMGVFFGKLSLRMADGVDGQSRSAELKSKKNFWDRLQVLPLASEEVRGLQGIYEF